MRHNIISFSGYFGDVAIEKRHEEIRGILADETHLVQFDFTKTTWIELSALIRLSVTLLSTQRSRDIIFLLPNPKPTTSKGNAEFEFLVESGFIRALSKISALIDCEILIGFNAETAQRVSIAPLRKTYQSIYQKSGATPTESRYWETKQRDQVYIDVRTQLLSSGNYESLFCPFGYSPGKLRDEFVLPLTILDKRTENSDVMLAQLEASKRSFERLGHLLFNDVKNTFICELLLNAIEHGRTPVVVVARIADLALHERSEENYEPFKYKSEFFEYCVNFSTKFIDIIVADQGVGIFEHLKEDYAISEAKSYFKRKGIKRKPATVSKALERKDGKYLILHRYALSPLSSSKVRVDPLYTSGLGIISQHIFNSAATLAIKDRDKLSYFNPHRIQNPNSDGAVEEQSTANYSATILNLLVPASDERWLSEHDAFHIKNDSPETNEDRIPYAYINIRQRADERRLALSDWLVDNSEDEIALSQPFKPSHSVLLNEIPQHLERHSIDSTVLIVDMASFKVTRKNTIWLPLIKALNACIERGICPILSNLDRSSFRMIQTLLDSVPDEHKPLLRREIFALLISDDNMVFWSGHSGCNSRRDDLQNYIKTGAISERVTSMLRDYTLTEPGQISFRRIDATLNLHRSKLFLEAIQSPKTHFVTVGQIYSYRGHWLGDFYAIREFLSSKLFYVNHAKDVARIISRENCNIVAVDTPELVQCIRNLQLSGNCREVSVIRIINGVFSEPNDEDSKEPLLLMPALVRSGYTLESIIASAHVYGIKIRAVTPILDLDQGSNESWRPDPPINYRPFVIAQGVDRVPGRRKYYITPSGSLIRWKDFGRLNAPVFKYVLNDRQKYLALQREDLLKFGGTFEGGHFYEIHVAVRRALNDNSRLNAVFMREFTKRSIDADIIAYPRQSELSHVLSGARVNRQMRKIQFSQLSIVTAGEVVLTDKYRGHAVKVSGKRVVFLDEGCYSWVTLISSLRALLALKAKSITVFVMEVRPPATFERLLLRDLIEANRETCPIVCDALFSIRCATANESPDPFSERLVDPGQLKLDLLQIDGVITTAGGIELSSPEAVACWALEAIDQTPSAIVELLQFIKDNLGSDAVIIAVKCLLLRSKRTFKVVSIEEFSTLIVRVYRRSTKMAQKIAILSDACFLKYPQKAIVQKRMLEVAISHIKYTGIERIYSRAINDDPSFATRFFDSIASLRLTPDAGRKRRILHNLALSSSSNHGFYETVRQLHSMFRYFVGGDHTTTRTYISQLKIDDEKKGDAVAHLDAVATLLNDVSGFPASFRVRETLVDVANRLVEAVGRSSPISNEESNQLVDLIYGKESSIYTFLTRDLTVPFQEIVDGLQKKLADKVSVSGSPTQVRVVVSKILSQRITDDICLNLKKFSKPDTFPSLVVESKEGSCRVVIKNSSKEMYANPASYRSGESYRQFKEELEDQYGGFFQYDYDQGTNTFITTLKFQRLFSGDV